MTRQQIRQSRGFWAGVAFFAGLLVSTFGAGLQVRDFTSRYASAQQVEALADTTRRHSYRITVVEAAQVDTSRKLDRLICYVEAMAEGRDLDVECVR